MRETMADISDTPENDFDRYFPEILGDYLTYSKHKAIAVARGSDGRFVFAYSVAQRSVDGARMRAESECQKRAGWFGIDGQCMLSAVDNNIVDNRNTEQ